MGPRSFMRSVSGSIPAWTLFWACCREATVFQSHFFLFLFFLLKTCPSTTLAHIPPHTITTGEKKKCAPKLGHLKRRIFVTISQDLTTSHSVFQLFSDNPQTQPACTFISNEFFFPLSLPSKITPPILPSSLPHHHHYTITPPQTKGVYF